jgi:hypothetical protein
MKQYFDVLAVIRATAPATLPVVPACLVTLVGSSTCRLGTDIFEGAPVVWLGAIGAEALVTDFIPRAAGEETDEMRAEVEGFGSTASCAARPLPTLRWTD